MRFHPLLMLAVLPALLFASCANDECCSADSHKGHAPEGVTVEDDYHATGNCALEFTAADSARRAAKHAEPGVKMVELSNGYRVFTQTVGESADVKILTLHGGPACTHEYMTVLGDILPESRGYEVIYYDQLGSYYSDQPTEDLWTIDRWCEEVEEVRLALGLNKDNFYILGNSWGGILGMEYALRYQENLKGLIVSNMVTSIPEYAAYNEEVLRPQMDPAILDSLEAFEAAGDIQNETFLQLVDEHFYAKHLCRLEEWPEAITGSFERLNYKLYDLMQGPSEFRVGGRLIEWDITDRLGEITVPTLMVGAEYDTMDPDKMTQQATLVANGRSLHCYNGSHLCMWDDQDAFMGGVASFIEDVNAGRPMR
ncbi:MAG: proline iminopeptidase-family hydrolase [Flavobacteriales bacterium]|nr:proline iminopeptidase-family hydrolase [Flavobacteriales bacterium]